MTFKNFLWEKLYAMDRNSKKLHEIYHAESLRTDLPFFLKEVLYLRKNYYLSRKQFPYPEGRKQKPYDENQWKKLIDKSDVVSFDIFDTLLFRPFSNPKDLFYFLESDNQIPDFWSMRIQAEAYAREEAADRNREVTLEEIYEVLARWCNLDIKDGAEKEFASERRFAYPNPAVNAMYQYAVGQKKTVIAVSDMYLDARQLKLLLDDNGYNEINRIFVSSEYKCSKRSGMLQKKVKQAYPDKKLLHIGDSKIGDNRMWKGIADAVYPIRNVNDIGNRKRSAVNRTINGSVYSGMINSKLYGGCADVFQNPCYELGYVYEGILTVGFCQWLHELVTKEKKDKIFFLARDCKVIKSTYDYLYSVSDKADADDKLYHNGRVETEYVKCSRNALNPVLCKYSYMTFLDRLVRARLVNGNMTIRDTFRDIAYEGALSDICNDKFKPDMYISEVQWGEFRARLLEKRDSILKENEDKYEALKEYMKEKLGDSRRILITDLGWNGSSILYLRLLFEKEFPNVSVSGAMFGAKDSAMAMVPCENHMIQTYLFSPQDFLPFAKLKHCELMQSEKMQYMEMLFSDTGNSVLGYQKEDDGTVTVLYEGRDVRKNDEIVTTIHKGILDFVKDYKNYLGEYATKLIIGRETAYTPLYSVLNRKCRQLDEIYADYNDSRESIHGFTQK